jgi:segregation and condensation protein A
MAPKQADVLSLAHLHAPAVSVREQAALVVDRLRRHRTLTFRALTGDAPDRVTTVARFLALLELFREGAVAFEQLTPLGELTIRWTGTDEGDLAISAEFDESPAPEEPA